MRCTVAFNLESGNVFWLGDFIREHWHSKKPIPSKSHWIPANQSQFPFHLFIRHRIPHGFISISEPVFSKEDDNSNFSFGRKDIEFSIENKNNYWTWWRKIIYYLESIFGAVKGEYYNYLGENDPFIVDKNNKKHTHLVSFKDMFTEVEEIKVKK